MGRQPFASPLRFDPASTLYPLPRPALLPPRFGLVGPDPRLSRPPLRNTQRLESRSDQVARDIHDLPDVIRGVCHRPVQRFDDEELFLADGDRTLEILRSERLDTLERDAESIVPPAPDLVARHG